MKDFKFKTGDTVELQSGSPRMTISEISDDGKCLCCWFDGAISKTNWFCPIVLTGIARRVPVVIPED